MSNNEFIYISKLDAAKRELEHAIRLFFLDGDIVVIHLTAYAALDILAGIGKTSGVKSMKRELQETIKGVFKGKQGTEALKKLNNSYNFIKHAYSDPNANLKFYPESNPFTIFDAVIVYQRLTGERTGVMESFRMWFYIKYPEMMLDGEKFLIENDLDSINPNDKSYFLKMAESIDVNISRNR